MSEFNFIVKNPFLDSNRDLVPLLFGEDIIEEVESITDMYDLLVKCGVFDSKGQARKNWKRTGKDIPLGFMDLNGIGKLKHRITIWNPIEII